MILGLAFALVCALGTNLSSLFKARGAVLARPIEVRHPLRSATDLFRQRWFAVGWILALFAWGLHIEAIALAPLSSVQAVLSGGLVFLAVLAERFFGFRARAKVSQAALGDRSPHRAITRCASSTPGTYSLQPRRRSETPET